MGEYDIVFLYKLQRKVSGAADSTYADVSPATYSISGSTADPQTIVTSQTNATICGYEEEQQTQYRWTVSGTTCQHCDDDTHTYVRYVNAGTITIGDCTYARRQQQTCTNGEDWYSTSTYILGDVTSCASKARLTYNDSTVIDIDCDSSSIISSAATRQHDITRLTTVVVKTGCTIQPTEIGYNAFSGATALTSVDLTGIETIGSSSFRGCQSLTSITLPSTITQIENSAFADNHNMMEMTILATTPPTVDSDAFLDNYLPYSGTLYVPSASLTAYQSASVWSDFNNIVGI